jgi:peroxiredoxin
MNAISTSASKFLMRFSAPRPRARLLLAAAFFLPVSLFAQTSASDAEADWNRILASESAPKADIHSQEQAQAATLQLLERQEKALRKFIADYPSNAHCFGAKLRLAHLLTVRSELNSSSNDWPEAMKTLDQLAASAPAEKKPDVAFARISLQMLKAKPGDAAGAEPLLKAAREFQRDYPKDRRVAPLLVELSTLFDDQPARKESLLQQARMAATDLPTQKRIEDDLKRLALLGKPLVLHFTSQQGKAVDLKDFQGKPGFVVFFAQWSGPSLKAVEGVQAVVKKYPQAYALGISLDKSPETASAFLKSHRIDWPLYCDGQGWNSPLARSYGLNSIPTVWLVDREGILRRLNVRTEWEEALREALR